ncbi:PREDICTED: pappalysin-2 [Nanorana parkeri]|uniref:pappalysin-2 n=1 Tax=Nanorana parkeri TaxID=125878 RepID=UPI000854BBC4|nr:PREDICTED: pappalysin-2 [Nanorana parkeri]
MQCLEIPFLTLFLLSCWGRPHKEDYILQRKQELVLKAEHQRLLSTKEPCRLNPDKRTVVGSYHPPKEDYTSQEQQYIEDLECMKHGCSVEIQKKDKTNDNKRGTKVKLGSNDYWNTIYNKKHLRHISKIFSKKSLRRNPRAVKERNVPRKENRRYPRESELNSQRFFSNSSVSFVLHQKNPIDGALYFHSAHSQLVLNPEADQKIPQETFTVELWVKPEGGQNDPAVITSMYDNCSHVVSDRGWSIGIRPAVFGSKKDARFYFSLRTDRSPSATTLLSPQSYNPGTWSHLAASYDGQQMLLYVDGVQVARAEDQLGPLHSTYLSICRSLLVGGDNSETGNHYRGYLFSLHLWSEVRTQKQLRTESMRRPYQTLLGVQSFSLLSRNIWSIYRDGVHPEVVPGLVPVKDMISSILLPPCGKTLCDLPDVSAGYSQPGAKWEKEVHYRVVNLCKDDGSRPLVSAEQIQRQHQALSDAFSPYSIRWQLNIMEVHNSSLRNRVVLPGCEPGKVGNDQCDPECKHLLTGNDGGDCEFFRPCNSRKKGDGVCHFECNTARDDYDDGDCCLTKDHGNTSKTCFDPDAPGRAYMSVKELKEALQLNNTLFLNIFFAGSAGEELAGAAIWPWDKEALNVQGGLIVNPSYYGIPGHTNTMIHEVGHALGLYHVFKGVSERESCDDPCSETEPSMETGDLCADTAPTPKNKLCRDPDPTNDTCGPKFYTGTPYDNYMSYSDDDCANSFTPNQVARMHCYLDLKYQGWSRIHKPSPVPLAPIVVKQSMDSLTIHWLLPISGELYERELGTMCDLCAADGSLQQYAHQASSPRVCDNSGYWTPEEAVGPPDVDQPCQPSLHAWSPELHIFNTNMSVPCTQPLGCILELNFLKAVQPRTLTIWITYLSSDVPTTLSDIELVTEHNESLHLGSMQAYCDTPLTIRLTTDQNVSTVRIYTFDARMEIDAVLLVSVPLNFICSACRPVKYRIIRNPPLLRDQLLKRTQAERFFTDTEVTPGQEYQYQVQVVAGSVAGEPSPPLFHMHGAGFCGDGEVNKELGEECDDGALQNGDGCSQRCQLEPNHMCIGKPSLCYIPSAESVVDFPDDSIGMSANRAGQTTHEYIDQWASQAVTSHEDPWKCPVSALIGEPVHKVSFDKPSLAESFHIYLSSDGSFPSSTSKAIVSAYLTDVTGQSHSLGINPWVSCIWDGLWSLPEGYCKIECDAPMPIINAKLITTRCQLGNHDVGSTCRYRCKPGYQVAETSDRRPRRSCSPLHVAHGSTHCSVDVDGETLCSVTCDEGHVLHSVSKAGHKVLQDTVLKCSSGKWNLMVTCERLDCGVPPPSLVFHASFSCPKGTGLGKQCFFTCLPPAKFQGINPWVSCIWDGLWSLPEGYCKIECDAPMPIINAKLITTRCQLGNHDVGSTCRYRCKPGYQVAETSDRRPRRKFLKIHCLQTGLWSVGRCIPILCEPLPIILQGMYSCTRGLEVDSKCTLYCGSYTVTTVCSKDGTWTEKLSLCEGLTGTCPPLPEINDIHYTCENGRLIGANCTASCVYPPNDPVILPDNMTPDSVEHWMNPTKVQSIMCTGTLKWYPNPATLHCIPSCEPFQADGWCDTINNRAYCQYDGGDCCASTLSSHKGQVVPFGAECEEDECTCRDPVAEENRSKKVDWAGLSPQALGDMRNPPTT